MSDNQTPLQRTAWLGLYEGPFVLYEIGYRLATWEGYDPYATQYKKLGMFDDQSMAEETLKNLREDYPQGEWRLLEVWF